MSSVIASWVNECEALVEWYEYENAEILGDNLTHSHLIHHKSHVDWPHIEQALSGEEACD